jgi:CRP/FNR family transcriptional regulator, cyclic AMP receptor protein
MLNPSQAVQSALNSLPIEVRALATRHVYEVSLKNSEKIVRAGKAVPGAMLLTQGVISVGRTSTSGESVVLCFARQNHWFLGDLVVGQQPAPFDCAAVGKATVLVWPSASLNEAFATSEALRKLVCDQTTYTQHRLLRVLEETLALTLPQRLARRLLELADLAGMPASTNENSIKLQAPVSHSLLAASLGVTRQRVHSQLREWSELGWLDSHYRDVVLHQPQALRAAAAFAEKQPLSLVPQPQQFSAAAYA